MKNFNTRNLFLFCFLLLFFTNAKAQVDTRFWFVAPEVTTSHGDNPVSFRITALNENATVNISMPANGFSETITVPANTQVNYEGLSDLNLIENRPANQILNKGILITSDVDITVYYDVAPSNNPDKFTLKGNNALGTEFFIPSQNAFDNHYYSSTPARERIDIVATEDGSEIAIELSDDIIGHSAGDIITITLNRGQTYSMVATEAGEDAARHLGGTHITASALIAVTISDDSIEKRENPGHWDLIGDQLIPVDMLGNEYIAMNTLYGENITTDQKVFILAVEDDTYLAVNGEYKATLTRGELHELTLGGKDNAMYITSDKPVYAYQVTGIPPSNNNSATRGTELGSAILPHSKCTGSTSVSFTRVLTFRFYVQLMTKESNRNTFVIEGPNDSDNNTPDIYLANPDWEKVPGTGTNGDEAWYSTVIQMGWSGGDGIPNGDPYRISNSGLFHMSILDENNISMSFGYFSDYSTLRISGPTMQCEGSVVSLETEYPMKTYNWYSDEDHENPFSNDPSIDVTESGKYWVRAEVAAGECFLTDSIDVEFIIPEFSLGNDTIVCPGETVTFDIDATNPGDQYLWTPGDETGSTYSVTPNPDESIDISLTMTDILGCSATDEITVTGRTAAAIDWNITSEDVCQGDTIKTTTGMHRYQWSIGGDSDPNDTLSYVIAETSGVYELTVWTEDQCSDSRSLDITAHPLPDVNMTDAWVCPGNNHTFNPGTYENYLWHDGSVNSSFTTNTADSVHVTVTDVNGCVAKDSAYFGIYNEQVFSFGSDTSVCINNNITIEVDDDFSNYEWTFTKDGTGISQTLHTTNHIHTITAATTADAGLYAITAIDNINGGCVVEGSFNLIVENVPDLDIRQEVSICEGDTIKIETQDHQFVDFEWTLDSDPSTILGEENFVLVSSPGTYRLTAWKANGCSNTETSTVAVWPSPDFSLTDVDACPGENFQISMQGWSSLQSAPDDVARDFEWSTGTPRTTFSTDPDLTNPDEGTYFLTVSDGLCFRTRSVDVAYYELPEINLEDEAFCDNETFTLTVPSELVPDISSYHWSQDATSDQGPSDSDWARTEEGDYTLNITDINNCESSGSLTLTHLPSPTFNLGADRDKCFGDTVMIAAGEQFSRYEWNGNAADGQTNVVETTNAGAYSLEVWTEKGCSSARQIEVDVNPLPYVDLGPDVEGCAGLTATLSIGDYPEIYWSTGVTRVNSITVERGSYSVEVVDENGCKSGDEMTLTWHPVPKVDLGPDLHVCPGECPVTIEAPEGFDRYEWHDGTSSRTIAANLMDTLNRVTVTDEHNCQGWDTKVVSALPPLPFSLTDTTACEPEDLVLDAGTQIIEDYAGEETITYIQSYRWGSSSTAQTDTIRESGEYWVEVYDGCHYLRDTAIVEYHPAPQIARLDTTYYAQVTVFAENGTQPYSYALDNEDNLQTENTFKNIENGEHTVYVEDLNECTAVTVFYSDSQYEINIPGFFTPNSDGYNDVWIIDDIDRLPDSTISIYDRYGKLLRKFLIADSPGWDGTYLNKPVPSDDYWYVIHLKPVDKIIKGNVTVKR